VREQNTLLECFQIHAADNVATLLQDAEHGAEVYLRGETATKTISPIQAIQAGHKVALCAVAEGAPIIKYGHTIGKATRAIVAGEWVHLHNCCSLYDAPSSALNLETGLREQGRND
jgi:altronate dehydratase